MRSDVQSRNPFVEDVPKLRMVNCSGAIETDFTAEDMRLAVLEFRGIEDHSMRVKLRQGVTISRACGIVLKLRRMIASDPLLLTVLARHGLRLCFLRFPHSVVIDHENDHRNGRWRGKRDVPDRPVFRCFDGFAVFVLVWVT